MLKIDTSQTSAELAVNSSSLNYLGKVLVLDGDESSPQPTFQLVHNHWAQEPWYLS